MCQVFLLNGSFGDIEFYYFCVDHNITLVMGNRTKKSIINAEVGFISYIISLFLAFFSRKIFLDNLGAEFIGLTGTLSNILGILKLSEMGIGLCIS